MNTNENNKITQIIIIVDDKAQAYNIRNEINDAIKEQNKKGILRYVKSVRVVVNEKVLSISSGMKIEDKHVVSMATAFILLLTATIF